MSEVEIIDQIKNVPDAERAKVARFMVEQDDSWIPEEFRQAMVDADAGRFVEMESVLCEKRAPVSTSSNSPGEELPSEPDDLHTPPSH